MDISGAVNLDRAIGLDRAILYKPRAPKRPPAEPSQAGSTACLENPDVANPAPDPAPITAAAQPTK